jgi:toxin ParE1/3/4
MARRIVKRRGAAADLLEHFVFIGEHSEEVALRFLHAAQETFELLATQPEIGRVTAYRNPLLAGMRVFPVKSFENYLVFYRPIRDGIEVVRVIHGARDASRVFES